MNPAILGQKAQGFLIRFLHKMACRVYKDFKLLRLAGFS